jgi:ACT domain-containing protein
MKNLINKFSKISHIIDKQLHDTVDDLAKIAITDVELAIAMNQVINENSLEVHNYKVEIVERRFADRNKKFYNIIDTEINETLQNELALFETALAMIKAYMLGKASAILELEAHDMEYRNALYEVYMYKNRNFLSEEIILAKVDHAKQRLSDAKQKIIRKL